MPSDHPPGVPRTAAPEELWHWATRIHAVDAELECKHGFMPHDPEPHHYHLEQRVVKDARGEPVMDRVTGKAKLEWRPVRKPSRRYPTSERRVCDCWGFEDVTQAELITRKLEVQHKELLAAIEALTADLRNQTEALHAMGRNILAVNESVMARNGQ